MTFKMILAAMALTLSPALASAMGCNSEFHDTTAMSCAEGMQMDQESGTCVPVVTG